MVTGIDDDSCLKYDNIKESYSWVLLLKPRDVKDKGIFQQAIYKIKTKIKCRKHLNLRVKVVKILLTWFKVYCPRCEYRGILLTSADTIRRFSHIQMEYLFGMEKLRRKSIDVGYEVKVSRD